MSICPDGSPSSGLDGRGNPICQSNSSYSTGGTIYPGGDLRSSYNYTQCNMGCDVYNIQGQHMGWVDRTFSPSTASPCFSSHQSDYQYYVGSAANNHCNHLGGEGNFESWLTSCSVSNGWGDSYLWNLCGNWAAGAYYCLEDTWYKSNPAWHTGTHQAEVPPGWGAPSPSSAEENAIVETSNAIPNIPIKGRGKGRRKSIGPQGPQVISNRDRGEMRCCIRKCDVVQANGQMVSEGQIHKLECEYPEQGDCSCSNSSESQYEAWLSSCSMYGWGNNYFCGSWAAGNYYCAQGTYVEYPCPEYGERGPGKPPSEWRSGGRIRRNPRR